MDGQATLRLTLVHDWLTGMRGGEKCLEIAARAWPESTLYTLIHQNGSVSKPIESLRIRTSFLQRLPGIQRYYRYLLPLMPFAVQWKIPACDAILSMSHCVAKGISPPKGIPHICYCFSPMRYAWHMKEAYFGKKLSVKAKFIDQILERLRNWDRQSSSRVSHFIAISKTVQERIKQCYHRDSVVIYPPVDTDFYFPTKSKREDFYLVVSAFAPYKRIDLAIQACQRLRRKLVIIGKGQDEARLKSFASKEVNFLGWQPDEVIRDYLNRTRALLFPGEEDFGIVPVEANACGTPVIAYGRGGATETVLPLGCGTQPTGIWFKEQSIDSLIEGIERFEHHQEQFPSHLLRRHAMRFNQSRFANELVSYVYEVIGASIPVTIRHAA